MSGKRPVVCYTEDGDRIDVVVDPSPVDGTFLVCNLRDAVKEKRKHHYANVDADQIPITPRGSTERLKGGSVLDPKGEYDLHPIRSHDSGIAANAPNLPQPTPSQTKRSRTVVTLKVMSKNIILGGEAFPLDTTGIIIQAGDKDTSKLKLSDVCRGLRDEDNIVLYNNEVCVVQRANTEFALSEVNSKTKWNALQCGTVFDALISTKFECKTITTPKYDWDLTKEDSPGQVSACLSHLQILLPLPPDFEVCRNTNNVSVRLPSGVLLSGTIAGAFYIRRKGGASNSWLVVSFELKKKVEQGDVYQASAEMVALETELNRTVPVLLTDLKDDWRLVYRADDGEINFVVLTRDEAVHIALELTSSFTVRTTERSHVQFYAKAPFPTFALQLKHKPVDSEAHERFNDELEVMKMSGCTHNEMRAFILPRLTFRGMIGSSNDETWRSMYV